MYTRVKKKKKKNKKKKERGIREVGKDVKLSKETDQIYYIKYRAFLTGGALDSGTGCAFFK